MDPSSESPDDTLGPLPARSYPGVNVRPGLVIDPILPHLITQGGLGDLVLEFQKELVWSRHKVAKEGLEEKAARFA